MICNVSNNFGDVRGFHVFTSDLQPVIFRNGHNAFFINLLGPPPFYRSLGGVRDREGLG